MAGSDFAIAGRKIGPGQPIYIVAELSANHGQDLSTAEALVRAAADAGADAVKLQTYTPDTITIDSRTEQFRIGEGTIWEGRVLHDLYTEAHTPWEWQPALAELARSLGMHCFSTPFDESAVEFLEEMGVPAYKVASFELVDVPLLQKIAATGKPIIISTGMALLGEIEEAVRAVRAVGPAPIALLRTSSAYPASPREIGLRAIELLAERFGVVVGLSDHTLGIAVPVAAAAAGARIIEKHLTLSREVPGPDSAFSLEPAEFKAMVEGVRAAEQALEPVRIGPTEGERASLPFRRSLFVVQDIETGERFTSDNVRSIRPAAGLHPRYLKTVLGRRAARDAPKGTPMAWELIAGKADGAAEEPWLSLRPAEEADCELVFAWANDPVTRRMSISTELIPWDDHRRWFAEKLHQPSCIFYIVTRSDGEPLGQVRLDLAAAEEAIISVSLAPEWRGRGYGPDAIRLAVIEARRAAKLAVIHAYIKPENRASIRAFDKAGFSAPVAVEHRGEKVLRMSQATTG